MIVVRVELWAARTGKVRELFRMTLANDGTQSDGNLGMYTVDLYRRGKYKSLSVLRQGRVEDFPRKSYHVGRLVLRALKSCFPEEK